MPQTAVPGCEDSQSLQAHILPDDQKDPHLDMLLSAAHNTLLQLQENDFRLLPQIIIPGGFLHDIYLQNISHPQEKKELSGFFPVLFFFFFIL